ALIGETAERIARIRASDEGREGVRSFLEKRKPSWLGGAEPVDWITLHPCVSARSFRPLWALEEIGVPYELKMLPFPPRVFARGFKDVNPLGTIPAFEEDAL